MPRWLLRDPHRQALPRPPAAAPVPLDHQHDV